MKEGTASFVDGRAQAGCRAVLLHERAIGVGLTPMARWNSKTFISPVSMKARIMALTASQSTTLVGGDVGLLDSSPRASDFLFCDGVALGTRTAGAEAVAV